MSSQVLCPPVPPSIGSPVLVSLTRREQLSRRLPLHQSPATRTPARTSGGFECRVSPCVVHFKCRGSSYFVHLKVGTVLTFNFDIVVLCTLNILLLYNLFLFGFSKIALLLILGIVVSHTHSIVLLRIVSIESLNVVVLYTLSI